MGKIIDVRDNKEYFFEEGGKLSEILKKLGINPELYVFVREGKLITPEDYVNEDDIIRMVPVVSGG